MFNLTVITFLFSFLASNPVAGNRVAHLSTSVALFVGFCLTLLGLWLLLSSQCLAPAIRASRPTHGQAGPVCAPVRSTIAVVPLTMKQSRARRAVAVLTGWSGFDARSLPRQRGELNYYQERIMPGEEDA